MFPHDYEVATVKVQELCHRVKVLRGDIEQIRDDFLAHEIATGGPPGPFAAVLDMALSHLVHIDISAEEVEEHRRE